MNLEKVKDPLTIRVLEFVKSKGGPSEVAREIGKKPAMFYLLESGKNKRPSSETLDLLKKAYPDFSADQAMTGEAEQEDVKQVLKRFSDEIARLNKVIEKKDEKISAMEEEIRGYIQDLRQIALNFPQASSLVTAILQQNQPMPEAPRVVIEGFRPSASVFEQLGMVRDEKGNWVFPEK